MSNGSMATVTPLHRHVPVPATLPPRPLPVAVAQSELEFVLDCVADGMIVVDERAQVLHANRTARELLGRVRDAAHGCGALRFTDRPTQQAFERALARCDDPDGGAHLRTRQFLVRDATGGTVARATVEPLLRRRHDDTPARACLVSLHRQPEAAEVSADSLRALYGLTPCEARVATIAIVAGSVDDLAQRLGLSRNTVKTHLKRVFRKCEVRSLAQLAALVATGPRLR